MAPEDDDLFEDEEFEDEEEVEEEVEEEEEEEEEDEEEEEESTSRRRGDRGGREASRRRSRAPKNYTLAFIVTLFLGPLGVDRFLIGEHAMGATKLFGTLISVALLFLVTPEQTGLHADLQFVIGLFVAFSMVGSIQIHDLFFFGLHFFGLTQPHAIVFCAQCGENMEIDLEQDDLQGLVCRYEECSNHVPPPEDDTKQNVRQYNFDMLNHSLYATGLFVAAAASLILAWYTVWPVETPVTAQSVAWPVGEHVENAMKVSLIGGLLLLILTMWQVFMAEQRKPVCEI